MLNIRTIIKPRQGGKSVTLIKMSAETGYPIVVKNRDEGRLLKKQAKEIGVSIPEPISLAPVLRSGSKPEIDTDHVLIDDADMLLNSIMQKLLGCEVAALTMVKRNTKGEEVYASGKTVK